jgi:hypothetical protein
MTVLGPKSLVEKPLGGGGKGADQKGGSGWTAKLRRDNSNFRHRQRSFAVQPDPPF